VSVLQILTALLPQSCDSSYYVNSRIRVPPAVRLQIYAHTTSCILPTCDINLGLLTFNAPEAGDFVDLFLLCQQRFEKNKSSVTAIYNLNLNKLSLELYNPKDDSAFVCEYQFTWEYSYNKNARTFQKIPSPLVKGSVSSRRKSLASQSQNFDNSTWYFSAPIFIIFFMPQKCTFRPISHVRIRYNNPIDPQ